MEAELYSPYKDAKKALQLAIRKAKT